MSLLARICAISAAFILVCSMSTCQANAALAAANNDDMPAEPVAPSVADIDNVPGSHGMSSC